MGEEAVLERQLSHKGEAVTFDASLSCINFSGQGEVHYT